MSLSFIKQSLYRFLLINLIFIGLGFSKGYAQPFDTALNLHEKHLDNGMRIIVLVDDRAPVAVSQIWYKVGSSYEHGGITGVSHILEHMMFKGTKEHPTGTFETIMSDNGARNNAFTSRDYTAYYEVMAADRIEVSLKIEADRMRNLILDQDQFEKELEVVKEERRLRTDDNPIALTYEHFNAVAFMNSPYSFPVIGWRTDLDNMQLKDLQDWYEKWYAPNNATLVVVGDVEPQQIFQWSERYFASIQASKITKPKPRAEVQQLGVRNLVVNIPAEVPYILMGYKVPGFLQAKEAWEPYALVVLASILDGGSSARFARDLVRGEALALTASAHYNGYGRLSDLFTLSGVPNQGISIEALKKAFLKQVQQLKDKKVTEGELKRVKASVIASEIYERDSIENMATIIGSVLTVGMSLEMINDYAPSILDVTPEQVQKVAKKYLIDDQLTVAELVPLPLSKNTTSEAK